LSFYTISAFNSRYFFNTGGVRNISNCMSIGTRIDRMSNGLKEKCLSEGWIEEGKEFNWKEVIGEPGIGFPSRLKSAEARFCAGERMLKELSNEGRENRN
jgi:hypothetical protein